MEESYLLLSFKEFIAKVVAEDFHSPELIDWEYAEEIMKGGPNFVHGKTNIDINQYKELSFLSEYEIFMEDPTLWMDENEEVHFKEYEELVENLINEYINQ